MYRTTSKQFLKVFLWVQCGVRIVVSGFLQVPLLQGTDTIIVLFPLESPAVGRAAIGWKKGADMLEQLHPECVLAQGDGSDRQDCEDYSNDVACVG